MNSIGLLLILAFYVLILFYIAHWAEKRSNSKWTTPYIYSFSLAVYCTAWTYYGSIGVAAESGLSYLPIYVGPVIIIPTWMIILKKLSEFQE
jgi:Na+/proline symporter